MLAPHKANTTPIKSRDGIPFYPVAIRWRGKE
jgi:hypothetical protein